jgi:hypothetical protein
MCDCLKQLESRLKNKFMQENPEATINESYFINSAWIQRNIKNGKTIMPLELTASHLIKYTIQSEKGKSLTRKNETNVCFRYCPFCGETINIEVVNEVDKNDEYKLLQEKRSLLWKKCCKTDSKKKEYELNKQVRELDNKINSMHMSDDFTKSNL